MGTSVNPDKPAIPNNPIAWTFQTKQGARAFYTSMGHPEDFDVEPFQRLIVNAVFWCLQKPEPTWPGKLVNQGFLRKAATVRRQRSYRESAEGAKNIFQNQRRWPRLERLK